MNTSDLLTALRDRLEYAAENVHADGSHLYDTGFLEGLEEAINILDGVEYEWSAMCEAKSEGK